MGHHAFSGRLLGRLGRRAGRRAHRLRGGQRHRLVDPQSRALLRGVRPQADLRDRAAARPGVARPGGPGRHLGDRPDGAERGGPRDRPVRDGGCRRDRRRGLAPRSPRAPPEDAARLQGGGHAHRSRRGGGSGGAGTSTGARRLPRQEEGEGEPRRAARHRHRGGEPRLHLPAARRHRGPADARRVPAQRGDRARARPGRRELLRADDAGQHRLAPGLARGQRDAAQDALALGRVLSRLGPAALPGGLLRRVPARSRRRALRADHRGQRPARARGRPALLGRLQRHGLPALHGGAVRLHPRRAAGRRADRGTAVRRPDVHRVRAAARARVPGLRAPAGLPLSAPMAEGSTTSWWQRLVSVTKALFWLVLMVVVLQQVYGSNKVENARASVLDRFQQERKSRVIALIHRQETVTLFGVPVSSSISIEDSEAVLRAIRLTPPEQPIDVILHTPGGLVLAAEQIAKALVERKAKVTVFVPHYAMSGGTLIALAADEIVMDINAVLGPVDPVVGDMPAGSIVRMVQAKGVAGVSDQMLVLADVAQMARLQVGVFTAEILRKHHPPKKAVEIATILSEGRWTHEFPITVQAARQLGFQVSTDMPRSVYDLMDLYPQGGGVRPSVLYVPLRRTAAPGKAPQEKSASGQP